MCSRSANRFASRSSRPTTRAVCACPSKPSVASSNSSSPLPRPIPNRRRKLNKFAILEQKRHREVPFLFQTTVHSWTRLAHGAPAPTRWSIGYCLVQGSCRHGRAALGGVGVRERLPAMGLGLFL